ncbi:hypothetical protein BC829DRAFT_378993 [Chytridium lagenaria]|nr:hypothetical protein BC829DRAFT_378993 [Chytridium lagenaria]
MGNPLLSQDILDAMLHYSPYLNARQPRFPFPNLLVTAGMNDPRVPFYEPVKFIARIRKTIRTALTLKKKECTPQPNVTTLSSHAAVNRKKQWWLWQTHSQNTTTTNNGIETQDRCAVDGQKKSGDDHSSSISPLTNASNPSTTVTPLTDPSTMILLRVSDGGHFAKADVDYREQMAEMYAFVAVSLDVVIEREQL